MLHEGARKVLSDYGGSLPSTAKCLKELPGIGPYTAGALSTLSIYFYTSTIVVCRVFYWMSVTMCRFFLVDGVYVGHNFVCLYIRLRT